MFAKDSGAEGQDECLAVMRGSMLIRYHSNLKQHMEIGNESSACLFGYRCGRR